MKTRAVTRTALLLALAIASQFLKNVSIYITGPIVNCILIIAAMYCGIGSGVFLSIVLPISSWLITASPIMSTMPVIVPCVMVGNLIYILLNWSFPRKTDSDSRRIAGHISGSIAKAAFMGLTISLLVLQIAGPSSGLPEKALNAAKLTFSLTQLITGLTGASLAFVIRKALDKASASENAKIL